MRMACWRRMPPRNLYSNGWNAKCYRVIIVPNVEAHSNLLYILVSAVLDLLIVGNFLILTLAPFVRTSADDYASDDDRCEKGR